MLENIESILNDLEDLNESLESNYKQEISNELNSSGLLVSNYKNNGLPGEFEDNLWVLRNELSKTHIRLDFSNFDEFKFVKFNQKDSIRIKLYISHLLIDKELEETTVSKCFFDILKFYKITNFMNEDFLSSLTQLITDETDKYKGGSNFSITAFNYLNFLVEKLKIDEQIYITYRNFLKFSNKKLKITSYSRTLPSSKDIMFFNYYIDKFFTDSNTDDELKLLFKPIEIWWKLTNVIPFRPSEFCVKLERNCVIEEDGNYYLKINRIKESNINNFPILNQVCLNEDIARLILDYIDKTDAYGNSETLFSYRASSILRNSLSKRNYNVKDLSKIKIYDDYFTLNIFSYLLERFYSIAIDDIYKDTSYNAKLKPGDTRHFAFFSLLMQGVSPVEIALLGGHSTLEMQINYQNCIEYYIGTELYDFLNGKKVSISDKVYDSLNNIINSLPKNCPKSLRERKPLNIGYCLCDFNIDACDNVDNFCCFCSKWWGEPTRITYDRLKLQIEQEIKFLENNTFLKLTALEELLNNNYNFNFRNKTINSYTDTKITINELKNSCDKIVGLRLSLITDDFIKTLSQKKSIEGDN